MGSRQFITLNGVKYDAHTGLRLDSAVRSDIETEKSSSSKPVKDKNLKDTTKVRTHTKAAAVSSVHRRQQKSSALRRNYVKKPVSTKPASVEHKRSTGRVVRSDQIVRFAPHPKVVKQVNDIVPIAPMTQSPRMQDAFKKAQQKSQLRSSSKKQLTSAEVKRGLIQAAAQKTPVKQPVSNVQSVLRKSQSSSKKTTSKKMFRLSHTFAFFAAIALLGGYLTYINMPGLSVQVASMQSGVSASYPDYKPDGYRFSGPVEYGVGEVTLNFMANGGGKGYKIDQKVSGWNSVAVLDNLVADDSNGRYDIEARNGIILYTYDNKVVWSNGGILYKIESEAPLSKAQLVDIAVSM